MKVLEKTIVALTIASTFGFCFFMSAKFDSNVSTNSNTTMDIGTSNMVEEQIKDVTIDNSLELKENQSETELKKATLNINNDNKQELFDMMLNTIDYYNTISGKFIDATLIGEEKTIDFMVDIPNQTCYESYNSDEVSLERYYLKDNEQLMQYDNSSKNYSIGSMDINPREIGCLDDKERKSIADDGNPSYLYRGQPAGTSFCNACIQPQELTFGFLSDFSLWDITGHENYLNRDCYVIEGTSQGGYNQKLNTYTFKMLVDTNTGVLLNLEGYDDNGNLSIWLKVLEISIDNESNISNICNAKLQEKQPLYENYSLY